MEVVHTLILLLAVSGVPTLQQTSIESMPNSPLDSEGRKVCIIGNIVKPSAVWFNQAITLTQAIKEAGGIPPDSKSNQVRISRRLEGSWITVIDADLKAIERGRAKDLPLEDNDIVEVMPKVKKKRVSLTQSTLSTCTACGCKLLPGMHGYLIVPTDKK